MYQSSYPFHRIVTDLEHWVFAKKGKAKNNGILAWRK